MALELRAMLMLRKCMKLKFFFKCVILKLVFNRLQIHFVTNDDVHEKMAFTYLNGNNT